MKTLTYKQWALYIAPSLLLTSGLLILSLYFTSSATVSLPQPTGMFKVGKATLHVVDISRTEYHSDNNSPRELLLHILYPAQSASNPQSPYADPATLSIIKEDLARITNTPNSSLNYLDILKSHTFDNAHVSPEQTSYPIIIFSPGWGMPTQLYSSILEDLASHGYIVVGINYPYVTNPVTFPDGRVIKGISQPKDPQEKKVANLKEMQTWVQDIAFVINELEKVNETSQHPLLKNKLDTKRIGVFGHSFGGSLAVEVCRTNKQCIAGADIEGKLYNMTPLDKPFMFIAAPHAPEILQPLKNITQASTNAEFYEIEGANHGSFTDLYLIASFKKDMLPALDPQQSIDITRKLLRDFFNKYLKKQAATTLPITNKSNQSKSDTVQAPVDAINHTLFIQGSLDVPALTKLKDVLAPLINKIIKEELGMNANDNFDFFLPKHWQRLTLYSLSNASYKEGATSIIHTVEQTVQEQQRGLQLKKVTVVPKLHFFGEHQDELVIMVNDPAGELVALHEAVKATMHKANQDYHHTHNTNLYNITKSERFPYTPHIGLGRIRSTSIKERIKDGSQVDTLFNRIIERILNEALPITQKLVEVKPHRVLFNTICIFHPPSRALIAEYPIQ